jgi:hypothetical protein
VVYLVEDSRGIPRQLQAGDERLKENRPLTSSDKAAAGDDPRH